MVGVQYKTAEVRALCDDLVRVNVYKDQVKGAASLPSLPNDKVLMACLQPSYNVLSNTGRRQPTGQPLYAVGGIQRTAADGFLQVSRRSQLLGSRVSGCYYLVAQLPAHRSRGLLAVEMEV